MDVKNIKGSGMKTTALRDKMKVPINSINNEEGVKNRNRRLEASAVI